MKKIICFSFIAAVLMACSPVQYNTIQTGPERFTVTGGDPNQLQGMAYRACKDAGYDDYAVLDNVKNRMIIRCEKTPPPQPSFTAKASEQAEKAWDYVKTKAEEYRKLASEKTSQIPTTPEK